MKALVKVNTVVDCNKVTITGELVDCPMPAIMAQRTTILHPVNGNSSKPRHIQVNSFGAMILRRGTDGILFPKEELVAIAVELDPALSDAPVFKVHPTPESLTGDILSDGSATASIEQSDDGKTWTQVPDADSKFKGIAGKHYRCVANNKSGKTISNPVLLK